MKKENIIQEKSYAFALKIVRVTQELINQKREYVLSKQLLKSGTSIGANIEEAIGAQSKKDFYSKITISYKEARETRFWLRLLVDSEILVLNKQNNLLTDAEELLKIIGSIQKTLRNSQFLIPNS
jgi:four helix bundle protein